MAMITGTNPPNAKTTSATVFHNPWGKITVGKGVSTAILSKLKNIMRLPRARKPCQ